MPVSAVDNALQYGSHAVAHPLAFGRGQAIAAGDLARATDDASLVEAAGGTVGVIDSHSSNIKVTVPGDLELAAYFLRRHR